MARLCRDLPAQQGGSRGAASRLKERFIITPLGPDSIRFEQAFSDEAGKSWEVNWIATDTRVKQK